MHDLRRRLIPAGLLTAWALGQPFLRWPALGPSVSSRLTLVVLGFGFGLWACSQASRPLPRRWLALVSGVLGVLAWHTVPIVQDGGYFRMAQETALLADGALFAVSLVFGLWGLRQLPVIWFRRLRWAGLFLVSVNLLVALWQWTHPVSKSAPWGLLGMPHYLAAYALLWLPIFWIWQPRLVLLPLALIALTGKASAWFALAVVCWQLRIHMRAWFLTICGAFALWGGMALWPKLLMRLTTWELALKETLKYPLLGQGFSPFVGVRLPTAEGFLLPSLHCDLLTLAIHAGWIVAVGAVLLYGQVLTQRPATPWAAACQASAWGLGVLALGQGVFGDCRIAGAALLLLVWWQREQESAHEAT